MLSIHNISLSQIEIFSLAGTKWGRRAVCNIATCSNGCQATTGTPVIGRLSGATATLQEVCVWIRIHYRYPGQGYNLNLFLFPFCKKKEKEKW